MRRLRGWVRFAPALWDACAGVVTSFCLFLAQIQSLMLLSTGDRLRMARDALAERLKVLVAKSALSQLGE